MLANFKYKRRLWGGIKLLVTLKKKRAIKKNKIAGRSNREEGMKSANRDIFEICFFD